MKENSKTNEIGMHILAYKVKTYMNIFYCTICSTFFLDLFSDRTIQAGLELTNISLTLGLV